MRYVTSLLLVNSHEGVIRLDTCSTGQHRSAPLPDGHLDLGLEHSQLPDSAAVRHHHAPDCLLQLWTPGHMSHMATHVTHDYTHSYTHVTHG